jgi:hypothetical protein
MACREVAAGPGRTGTPLASGEQSDGKYGIEEHHPERDK